MLTGDGTEVHVIDRGSGARSGRARGRRVAVVWPSGSPRGSGAQAQHRGADDRRHARRRPGADAGDAAVDRRGRRDVHPRVCLVPAVLPVARDAQQRPVRAQPRRARQRPTARRLPGAHRPRQPAGPLAAGRGLLHGPHRQVPQRLRQSGTGDAAAGMVGLAGRHRRLDVPDVGLPAARARPARHLRRS